MMRLTKHAKERMTSRSVPQGIVDFIFQYGETARKDTETKTLALSKKSMKRFRKEYGDALAKALEPFRRAYIVVSEDAENVIVTVAYARQPLHG